MTITEINEAYVKNIKEKEPEVQAFVTELTDKVIEQAKKIQEKKEINLKRAILIGMRSLCIYLEKDENIELVF